VSNDIPLHAEGAARLFKETNTAFIEDFKYQSLGFICWGFLAQPKSILHYSFISVGIVNLIKALVKPSEIE